MGIQLRAQATSDNLQPAVRPYGWSGFVRKTTGNLLFVDYMHEVIYRRSWSEYYYFTECSSSILSCLCHRFSSFGAQLTDFVCVLCIGFWSQSEDSLSHNHNPNHEEGIQIKSHSRLPRCLANLFSIQRHSPPEIRRNDSNEYIPHDESRELSSPYIREQWHAWSHDDYYQWWAEMESRTRWVSQPCHITNHSPNGWWFGGDSVEARQQSDLTQLTFKLGL